MSRYSLKPLPHRADLFEVAVGWDPGLATYFVMVFGAPPQGLEPEVRRWSGGSPRQIPSVEELLQEVQDYAAIDPELISRLQADQSARRAEAPRPARGFISRLLGAP